MLGKFRAAFVCATKATNAGKCPILVFIVVVSLRGAIHLAQRALDGGGDGHELSAQVKKMKQEAFHSGLWFGTALGAIGTGLLVRFWLFPTGKRR
jgi:hypothetical protein